jgi:hypothetical protein
VGDVEGPTMTKETARKSGNRVEIREKVPSMTVGVFAEKLAASGMEQFWGCGSADSKAGAGGTSTCGFWRDTAE